MLAFMHFSLIYPEVLRFLQFSVTSSIFVTVKYFCSMQNSCLFLQIHKSNGYLCESLFVGAQSESSEKKKKPKRNMAGYRSSCNGTLLYLFCPFLKKIKFDSHNPSYSLNYSVKFYLFTRRILLNLLRIFVKCSKKINFLVQIMCVTFQPYA